MSTSQQRDTTHPYHCAECGADMRYVPASDHLACVHCGATREISAIGPWDRLGIRQSIQDLSGDAAVFDTEETGTLTCQSCAAEIWWDGPVHAMECPFCASPNVAPAGARRHIKPDAIAPFSVDQAAACAAFGDWLRNQRGLPGDLHRRTPQPRDVQGLYLPFWAVTGTAHARYQMAHGDQNNTRTRIYKSKLSRDFVDLPVVAVGPPYDASVWGLEPWFADGLTPYRADFLSGFKSAAYTVPAAEGAKIAEGVVWQDIKTEVTQTYAGTLKKLEISLANVSLRLVLLPVWCFNYRHHDRSWRVLVNGQTGKVHGEAPASKTRATWLAILGVLSVPALLALTAYLTS